MESPKPKRRVRYQGSHPRHFNEKYKELNAEKYSDDVAKVIESGKTPAGTHRPICVEEILDFLNPLPGQVGLDATLGYGGHALELLKRILPDGRLFAFDVDPIELEKTRVRFQAMGFGEKELILDQSNFAGIFKILPEAGGAFDFILADLGISSMQLDNPQRGFTFKKEGPLDLRLNPNRGKSAVQLIQTLNAQQLENIFINNADEPCAGGIARAVFKYRQEIKTTTDLANVIAYALDQKSFKDCTAANQTSIRRIFQALRIEVNNEFIVLEQFLQNLPFCLKSKGRVAILTFHAGEDRRVMNSFELGLKEGTYLEISEKPIRPSSFEQNANSRSKSAILRWAIKK